MSDRIKHECGIGLIRLLKPLAYFQEKYGSPLWGFQKMYLLMEKQRNRGQDGAGLGCIKLDMKPGHPYHARSRSNAANPWTHIYNRLNQDLAKLKEQYPEEATQAEFLKENFDFAGEVLLGHLRYGTHGTNTVNHCHPVIRTNNYVSRCLLIAGNFNLTNVDRIFRKLVDLGQHPRHQTDTETMLERIGHFLDKEFDQRSKKLKKAGYKGAEIAELISEELSVRHILKNAAKIWDGGYVLGGVIGNGDAFMARDPNGIRPCYYYHNDEFAVAASERAAISTVFELEPEVISELKPGHVWVVKGPKKAGKVKIYEKEFIKPQAKLSCSFERIYFSRGSDIDIYQERKELGRYLLPRVLESVDYDLAHTVFGFIPNTAESSFLGLIKEVETYMNSDKVRQITELGPEVTPEQLTEIIEQRPRVEKILHKDVKMRTFIADDSSRDDLVSHVYDVTRGIIQPGVDNLVCIDDSIVRGTTLKKSILKILGTLKPRKIVILSSAPQIRYPDCYGIDMARIDKLIAFNAAISLLRERGMERTIKAVYEEIISLQEDQEMESKNVVKGIYEPFSQEEVSAKITELLLPKELNCELDIVFQSLESLHRALPNHQGDWYFSGNYPTPGGNRIVNQSYLNFYEGKAERAYQLKLI